MSLDIKRGTKRATFRSLPLSGTGWNNKLQFTPVAEDNKEYPVSVENESLMSFFDLVEGSRDVIRKVYSVKERLSDDTPKIGLLFHESLVVESSEPGNESVTRFWSFEKGSEGIFVQRSNVRTNVQDYYRTNKRKFPEIVRSISLTGRKKPEVILQIFQWIFNENFLYKGYHLTASNCQCFVNDFLQLVDKKEEGLPELRKEMLSTWPTSVDYTPDANNFGRYPIEITEDELLNPFIKVADTQARIIKVQILRQKDTTWLPTWISPVHTLVAIETRKGYWSFEYFLEGIACCRSKEPGTLEKHYRGKSRSNVEIKYEKILKNGPTIVQMFQWIKRKEYVQIGILYPSASKNHTFSDFMYNEIKEQEIIEEEPLSPNGDDSVRREAEYQETGGQTEVTGIPLELIFISLTIIIYFIVIFLWNIFYN